MTIKDKYYYPNNSLLVICGDVQHEAAFALAQQIWGDWAASSFDPFEKYPVPEFAPLKTTDYFVKESSLAQTPNINMWWRGPDLRYDSAGTLAADVFSTILGLNSSRWQQALVDKGLATYAALNYQTERYVGPISIYVMPNPNKLKECVQEMLNQVKMWNTDDYFTDEQMEDAKQTLRRNSIRQNEKPSTLSSQLTYWWCSTSYAYGTDYIANCMKVTKADIKRYVNKYISNQPHVAGIIISPDMNKKFKPSEFFKPGS
jgi:zinc protease